MDNVELQRNLETFFPHSASQIPEALTLTSRNLGDDGCMKLVDRIVASSQQTRSSSATVEGTPTGQAGAVDCDLSPQQVPILEHLDISCNGISGTIELAQALVAALQINPIRFIDLSNNPLSDDFRETFLAALQDNKFDSLRVLKLDATGLTATNVRMIAAFLSSRHCRLLHLSISSNAIISKGCGEIVNGLKHCRSLGRLDWDNNQPNVSYPSNNHGLPVYSALNGQFLSHKVRGYLTRNLALKSQMSAEARELLRASRRLHLNSSTGVATSFWSLPPELKQKILSLLAPTLSPRQHVLIYSYALDKTTLPEVSPTLHLPHLRSTSASQTDRTAASRSVSSFAAVDRGSGKKFGSLVRADTGTETRKRPGGLINPANVALTPSQLIEDQRISWLEIVQCDLYEGEEN